jgi:hypothetical protein
MFNISFIASIVKRWPRTSRVMRQASLTGECGSAALIQGERFRLQFSVQIAGGDFMRVARNHAQHLPLSQQGIGLQLSHGLG